MGQRLRQQQLLTQLGRVLEQISAWLPSVAPPIDWAQVPAAVWRREGGAGRGQLQPIHDLPTVTLDDLVGIERQKTQLITNTRQFLSGFPANNVLLSGARGTGKSSLVQALLQRYFQAGLRVVQVDKSDLEVVLALLEKLPSQWRFILYCDDLSFEEQDEGYKALKSALDGGVLAPPPHVLIYATSNRRHLMPEYMSDNDETRVKARELHHGEGVEEKVSLSDRFGLWLSIYPMNQDIYLEAVQHWLVQYAAPYGLNCAWTPELRVLAVRWADNRGTRSGRTAAQFARHWVGQQLLSDQK